MKYILQLSPRNDCIIIINIRMVVDPFLRPHFKVVVLLQDPDLLFQFNQGNGLLNLDARNDQKEISTFGEKTHLKYPAPR